VDCQRVEQKEMIEKYLAGKLAEAEAEAFEQHYLGCQSCFDELRFHHATAIELRNKHSTSPQKVAMPRAVWWPWAVAAAAILLLTLVSVPVFYRRQDPEIVQTPIPQQSDSPQAIIAQLASVEASPYVPLTLRGGSGSPASERFQLGMERYSRRDYASASGLLEQAVGLKPNLQPALFYLGVSQLLTDQPDKAIATLSALVRIEATPYLEESHWFLAKAFLKKHDLVSAEKELEAAVMLNGAHLDEARRDLGTIRGLAAGRIHR